MTSNLRYCFVFARGGSKGLRGKNLLTISGIPLVAHSIIMAKKIERISKVFVSTDSEKISVVGKAFGAEVIERPTELASDTASEWDAWRHAISHVEAKYGSFNQFISLPATAPCRRQIDVERCMDSLNENADIVITTTKSQRSPWFNMVIINDDGFARLVNDDQNLIRRQDCPKCQDITTIAYVTRPSYIKNSNGIWDGKVRTVEVPQHTAIDIDTFYDYSIAKFTMEDPGLLPKLNRVSK